MKFKLFALASALILLASPTSNAGHGYLNQVGRNIGYGISDGYHAQRYCLEAEITCHSCSPVQPRAVPQRAVPQPMMMQPPVTPQPTLVPANSAWVPQHFQPVVYPVTYPVAPMYQTWHQSLAPSYGQPWLPSVAIPNRTPPVR